MISMMSMARTCWVAFNLTRMSPYDVEHRVQIASGSMSVLFKAQIALKVLDHLGNLALFAQAADLAVIR